MTHLACSIVLLTALLSACNDDRPMAPPSDLGSDLGQGDADLVSTSDGCAPGSCGTGAVCVDETKGFCGGAAPPCYPTDEHELCPPDTEPGSCGEDHKPGCVGTCKVTGHHCVVATCDPATCACLPADVCTVGSCGYVQNGIVQCLSASAPQP